MVAVEPGATTTKFNNVKTTFYFKKCYGDAMMQRTLRGFGQIGRLAEEG